MKSKKILCGALAATLTLGVGLSGCTLTSTQNEEDMKQVVATVNISKSANLAKEGLDEYKSAITSDKIIKRDLIAAFLNVGYSYYQQGQSLSNITSMLMDSLTSTTVITQYATLYMLKEKAATDGKSTVLSEFTSSTKTEAQKYEYLLGGEDSDDVMIARYKLYSAINSTLDSSEKSKIKDTKEEYVGTANLTTPTGVNTEVENYFPKTSEGKLDYAIYTGYEGYLLENAGAYEPLDGTNRNTRRQAYSEFITTLKNNYLISSSDKNPTDVMSLSYIQEEYVSQLQQMVINNYYDLFTKQQEDIIKSQNGGVYTYIQERYNKILNDDQRITNASASAFESALGSMNDSSFVLYAPNTQNNSENKDGGYGTFGLVYNILLPFDEVQSRTLSEYKEMLDKKAISENEYYILRRELLSNITTYDRRAAWFNGSTDYSFNASESTLEYYGKGEGRDYLFFENNLTKNDQYESLDKYVGLYSFNGSVVANKDGSYSLRYNKLDMNGMLAEFSAYINYVLGGNAVNCSYVNAYNADSYYVDETEKEIDYSKFVYATGKVDISDVNKNTMFVSGTEQYKAMSAVNELQYAYTTDTGVLSQYIGYTVGAYTTNYIKEFEYAAQTAVKEGVGTFKVCAGDYGWHLIYVTDVFNTIGGEVYSPVWTAENVENEGSFEYKFYEWIKDSTLSEVSTQQRKTIIANFGGDTTVKLYKDAYANMLG